MAATSIDQGLRVVREFNDSVFKDREYDKLPEILTEDFVQRGPMMGQEL